MFEHPRRYCKAKVAKAESEYLRAAGTEVRDRSAATEVERSIAQRENTALRELVSKLEVGLGWERACRV